MWIYVVHFNLRLMSSSVPLKSLRTLACLASSFPPACGYLLELVVCIVQALHQNSNAGIDTAHNKFITHSLALQSGRNGGRNYLGPSSEFAFAL